MNDLIIPADIEALVEIGVDEWHAQAGWPVDEEAFSSLVGNIFQSFGEYLNTATPALQDVFLADLHFISFLGQYFHAAIVNKKANHASITVTYSDLARPYYAPDWNAIAMANRSNISAIERVLYRPREAVRRYRFNHQLSPIQRVLTIFQSSEYWSIGAFSNDKLEYLRPSKFWVETPYLERFPVRACNISKGQEQELSQAVERCLHEICSRASLPGDLDLSLADVSRTWVARLTDVYRQYLAVMASARSAKVVLTTGVGNTANRIMALAAKRKGAHVVAFSHGNDTSMIDFNAGPFQEYAVCSEYVSISQSVADYLSEQNSQNGWSFCSGTKFSSLETMKYQKQLRLGATDQVKAQGQKKIKSVMLSGYPMHPQRYLYGAGNFFPFRLRAELDAVRILRKAGYHVIYKPHPETQQITSKIMESRVDEIIYEPFESVMDRADCLLFTYTATTTLGAALATAKPIVLFNHKGQRWNKSAYEKLQLRCAMVPTSLDKNSRNKFSEADLLDAVTRAPTLICHSYLNDFMSPAGWTAGSNRAN